MLTEKQFAFKTSFIEKINASIWTAKGHLNTGVPYGDEDWYSFEVKDSSLQGYLSLEGGREIDGVLSIYQNGRLLTSSDYYPSGQNEVLPFILKKGKYSIKVRDYYGNSTILPYTLKVEKNKCIKEAQSKISSSCDNLQGKEFRLCFIVYSC